MTKHLYCVFDKDAQVISNDAVFLAANDDHAARMLREAIPADALPRKYPKSFQLICLGTIDTDAPSLGGDNSAAHPVCDFTSLFPATEE